MDFECQGRSMMRTPSLKTKICPVCGNEIDLFSCDIKAVCDKCGFTAWNDTASCLKWCKHAKECVGEEAYNNWQEQQKELAAVNGASA
jgi:ribosomal protein S27AE